MSGSQHEGYKGHVNDEDRVPYGDPAVAPTTGLVQDLLFFGSTRGHCNSWVSVEKVNFNRQILDI